jgi:hypothetical protein
MFKRSREAREMMEIEGIQFAVVVVDLPRLRKWLCSLLRPDDRGESLKWLH